MKMLQFTKKTRFVVVYPAVTLVFVFAKTSEATMLWGALLVLAGEGIRIWANGFIGHNKVNRTCKNEGEAPIGKLITAGPYAYVRHPLYLGTFIILLGVCLAAGKILFALLFPLVFCLVYNQKMNEEDRLLLDELGPEYDFYKKTVPKWIPRIGRYCKNHGIWSWQGIRASKEWKTVLWIIVLFIVLYFREEVYQEQEFFNETYEIPKHLFFLFMVLSLILVDVILALKKRFFVRT